MITIHPQKFALTAIVLTALAVSSAACGSDDAPLTVPAATVGTTAPANAVPDEALHERADAAVKISQTPLGDVLASPTGMTLYGFTNDIEAESTCSGTCAEAWPPVIVTEDFIVSPGLDSGVFATTVRDDGQLQLVAGKFPLYLYAADSKPGDVTGQSSGDVWFAIDPSGRLITDEGPIAGSTDPSTSDPESSYPESTEAHDESAAEAEEPAETVRVSDNDLGTIVTDADGRSLYLFTQDEAGTPTCSGGCAEAWPPLLVDAEPVATAGIDPTLLSTVEHPDGGRQLKIGKWPVYRFAGDAAPGDAAGQGSGGDWFLIGPDATSIT
jgi:predicted lipoprotein with Yx(FWY)xxD motif